ncbi:hypothetical protein ES703_00015 [subsurface metagenome]
MMAESKTITLKRLPKPEFKEYLYAPPLEVPENYSPEEAVRKGLETGDWADYEIAARMICRLMIEAAENGAVRRWLLATRVIGDGEWNKLIVAIGRETPDIAKQINELGPSHLMLNWCVFSAAYLIEDL